MKKLLLLLRRSTDSYILPPVLLGLVMALGVASQAQAKPELKLVQSVEDNLTSVLAGQEFIYKLQYRCASTTEDCMDVQLKSTLLAELDELLEEFAPTGDSHPHIAAVTQSGGAVTWQFVNPLPAGSTGDLTLTIKLLNGQTPDGTEIINEASIEASNADTVVSNTVTMTVTADSVVTLTKELLSGTPRLDMDTNYQISLCNEGGEGRLDLQNVTMVDPLPPNAIFISAGKNGIYNADTNTISWQIANLAIGKCFEPKIKVQYPATYFSEGEITNMVEVLGTPVGEVESKTYADGATGSFGVGIGEGIVGIAAWKQGSKTVTKGGILDYGFTLKNTGSVDLENVIITDTVPSQLVVTSLRVGENNQPTTGSIPVSIDYQTNLNSAWISVSDNPFATPPGQSIDVSSFGLSEGEYITELRWTLPQVPVGFRSESSIRDLSGFSTVVLLEDRNGQRVQVGDEIENTAAVEYTYDDNINNKTVTKTTEIVYEIAGPRLIKTVDGATTITPGGEVTYRLQLVNREPASVVNPTIVDVLNNGLEYVDWKVLLMPTNAPSPIFEQIDNYKGTGKTALLWKWSDGSAYSLEQWEKVRVKLVARVKSMTSPGSITNTAYVIAENPTETIALNSCLNKVADVYDLDGDNNTAELLCASEQATITASTVAAMDSTKWVKGQLDPDYHRYPNWGKTARAGTLRYRLIVKNTGNISMTNVVVVDILPFITDTGVIDLSQRESAWQPRLIGAVQAGKGIKVSYSTEENPCRTEVLPNNPPGCKDPQWTPILPADISAVRSLRFDFGNQVVEPGDELKLEWPMVAPVNAPLGTATKPSIAWNSFGYVATQVGTGTQLLPSEPIKVGIEVNDFEPATYGNYVWLDENGDGLQDDSEIGFNGVRVDLYEAGDDGQPNTADDVFINFTRTADGPDGKLGFYIFSFLDAGKYYAKFERPVGYKVSPQDVGNDDNLDSDVNEVTHTTIVTNLADKINDDRWDMGLVEQGTAALGNYVWFDRNQDGLQNESADNGINGVQVTLYRDNGDGKANPASDEQVGEPVVTKNDIDGQPGYYLFDDIKSGQYFVKFSNLPRNADGFTIQGATGTSDPTDSDPNSEGVTEVTSLEIGEYDRSWDAGVIKLPSDLALGNRVWLDQNEDGIYDVGSEKGINDVTVNLYWDADGNGEYTPNVDKQVDSMRTFTKNGVPGYYLFEELIEGDYIVQIDVSNFSKGSPLAGLMSSTGAPDPEPAKDHDDNGKPMAGHGVVTSSVTLSNPADPNDEVAKRNLTVDFGFHPNEFDPFSCINPKFFALHDEKLNDTQFFTIDPNTRVVAELGPLQKGLDVEGLDMHPLTGKLYATSGDDPGCKDPNDDLSTCERHPHGHLYELNPNTGKLTPIGSTGFGEVSGISFHPNGTLWAWADREGLLTIDLVTGQGTLIFGSKAAVEALTWDTEGQVLYGAANTDLWAASDWDANMFPQDVRIVCQQLPGQVEALDMANGNLLLFAMNERSDLNINGWKIEGQTCPPDFQIEVKTPAFYDIEAITWPASCDVNIEGQNEF